MVIFCALALSFQWLFAERLTELVWGFRWVGRRGLKDAVANLLLEKQLFLP